jgi:hypothetical protein
LSGNLRCNRKDKGNDAALDNLVKETIGKTINNKSGIEMDLWNLEWDGYTDINGDY